MDEPTAALGGEETDRLFAQIDQLRKQGVSFIYISHRLEEIARIADRIVVLRDGRLVATHDSAQVPVNVLLENMVGRNVDRIFPNVEALTGKEVLRVEGLTGSHGAFRDVNFSVRAGEIFGIAGIVGAGRTELVRAIAGADPSISGSVFLDGQPLQLKSPSDAIKAGIVLVPEDRKAQGVVLDHTLASNLALGNFDRLAPTGWMMPAKVVATPPTRSSDSVLRGRLNSSCAFYLVGTSRKRSLPDGYLVRPKSSCWMNQPGASTWAPGPLSMRRSPGWLARVWRWSSSAPTWKKLSDCPIGCWCSPVVDHKAPLDMVTQLTSRSWN